VYTCKEMILDSSPETLSLRIENTLGLMPYISGSLSAFNSSVANLVQELPSAVKVAFEAHFSSVAEGVFATGCWAVYAAGQTPATMSDRITARSILSSLEKPGPDRPLPLVGPPILDIASVFLPVAECGTATVGWLANRVNVPELTSVMPVSITVRPVY
jgi:hypothetical protein